MSTTLKKYLDILLQKIFRGTPRIFEKLNGLQFDESAQLHEITLPSVALCWSDEMLSGPILFTLSKSEREMYYTLFSIRTAMWKGDEISSSNLALWDEFRRRAPGWPGFRRIEVTDRVRTQQAELENRVLSFFKNCGSANEDDHSRQ